MAQVAPLLKSNGVGPQLLAGFRPVMPNNSFKADAFGAALTPTLAIKIMAYHHVIAKVGSKDNLRVLFSDLSSEELKTRFIKPYEKGNPFFSGNDLISPSELRSVQIIRTENPDEVERSEINRKDRESIDRHNDSSSGVFFMSIGAGHQPQDIAEAGEDLTHTFIKGPPGFKAGQWEPSLKALAWVGGIIATVTAAGIVKWFGWL